MHLGYRNVGWWKGVVWGGGGVFGIVGSVLQLAAVLSYLLTWFDLVLAVVVCCVILRSSGVFVIVPLSSYLLG